MLRGIEQMEAFRATIRKGKKRVWCESIGEKVNFIYAFAIYRLRGYVLMANQEGFFFFYGTIF